MFKFRREKKAPVKRLVPLVLNGETLPLSVYLLLTKLLRTGHVVVLCKSAYDYTDNGLPLLFGKAVMLSLDADVETVRYQFTENWEADIPTKHDPYVRVFKLADQTALSDIFTHLKPYEPSPSN